MPFTHFFLNGDHNRILISHNFNLDHTVQAACSVLKLTTHLYMKKRGILHNGVTLPR